MKNKRNLFIILGGILLAGIIAGVLIALNFKVFYPNKADTPNSVADSGAELLEDTSEGTNDNVIDSTSNKDTVDDSNDQEEKIEDIDTPDDKEEPDEDKNDDKEASGDEEDPGDNSGDNDNPDDKEEPGDNDNPDDKDEPGDNDNPDDKPDKPGKKPGSESGTPVDNHGELQVSGTQIVDKNGSAYQLQGVSTHGIAWFPEYVNKDAFRTIRDEWGANCIRLAMYSAEYNGYNTGGDKDYLKNLVKNGVSYATDLGLYVIIDWHVLGDQDPNTYKSEAITFFDEMSSLYADYDNVIYEICNEPNGGVDWSQVKSYAEEVIPVIKANNENAIIIVGTPTWSQDVDKAQANPITGYTNIMYALHFYADTHKDFLRDRFKACVDSGLPIFVSEFGICDASGNGANNYTEGEKWISLLDSYGASYCIWNLSNKNETSSLIASGCSKTSGWSESELSDSGKWYVGILGNGVEPGSTEPDDPKPDDPKPDDPKPDNPNPPSIVSDGTLEISVAQTGSWNDGTKDFYQYTITLKAKDGDVSGWELELDFGTEIKLDQSWSGNFDIKGGIVKVTPVDYNSQISNGQSVEVGLIFSASGSIGNPTITVK